MQCNPLQYMFWKHSLLNANSSKIFEVKEEQSLPVLYHNRDLIQANSLLTTLFFRAKHKNENITELIKLESKGS